MNRRHFLAGCAAWPLIGTLHTYAGANAHDDASPWFRWCLVGMEVGPTGAQFGHSDLHDTRYAVKFDGAEIVRRCVAAHSEYLVMWVRDGDFAYYDSKILPKAPGLGTRDPLQEAIDEAKKHDLPVISYCVVQQGGHFLQQHPEWAMHGADGKPLGRFCLSSGYLEAMKEILAEQLAYGIAGFHIDMLDQGFGPPYGCWSPASRDAFQRAFGHPMPEMPNGPSWDTAWNEILEFRYLASQQFEQELAAHVRRLNPDATVDFNYHGNPPFSWEVGQRPVQHAGNGDFVTGETGVWGFSALGVGLNAEFYRASTPGIPFQVAMQRGVRMYHDQTTRPLNDMRWELFTLLSHGAFVTMVDKTAFDGSLDTLAYQRFGELFAEARSKRQHFGQSPIYNTALFYSSRTRDWIGKENPGLWMQSFCGAHKALRYDQLNGSIVFDERVSAAELQEYPSVIVANAGILPMPTIAAFRSYVEQGGSLIITGHSGQFDHLGQSMESIEWQQLIGARPVRRLDSLDNWLRFPADDSQSQLLDKWVSPVLPRDWSFLVKGPATVYEPATAIGVGQLWSPARTIRQQRGQEGTEWPMSPGEVIGPAMLVQPLGRGTVITIASSPDYATASEHHVVEARKLLSHIVQVLDQNRRVEIVAPSNVQTVVTDDPKSKTIRVHFLGYNSPPQTIPAKDRPMVLPPLIEDPPMYRAKVTLKQGAIRDTGCLDPNTERLLNGNTIMLTINAIHEVLLIEYS
ncbi:MAG: hypothetical protein JNK57_13545 [Planctomycetaceae bacterium]|nr:hypothetical protein [Planctomycetaceae bacterium]